MPNTHLAGKSSTTRHDACSTAFKRPEPDHRASKAALARFLAEQTGPKAESVEKVFAELHGVITTNVCLDQAAPFSTNSSILSGSWFRYSRSMSGNSLRPQSDSFCESRSPLPHMQAAGHGGVWIPVGEGGMVVPCKTASLDLSGPRALYCWPGNPGSSSWRSGPPPEQTAWLEGVTLTASESHVSNFHHWARDMAFWARIMRLGYVRVRRLLASNRETPMAWAMAHTQALMPTQLVHGMLWNMDGAHWARTRSVTRAKQEISRAAVLPAKRYLCFEAMLQKTHDYANDALDVAHIRAQAYAMCDVKADAQSEPPCVLLETRGDTATTSRRIANLDSTRALLAEFAEGLGLALEVRQFSSRMSYCDQVRLASRAKLFFGVHGQAQENAIFMRPGAMLMELFHTSYRNDIRRGGVGRQQLFRGSDMHYASAALLESNCSQAKWKFDPSCPSHVNLHALRAFLMAVATQLASHESWSLLLRRSSNYRPSERIQRATERTENK